MTSAQALSICSISEHYAAAASHINGILCSFWHVAVVGEKQSHIAGAPTTTVAVWKDRGWNHYLTPRLSHTGSVADGRWPAFPILPTQQRNGAIEESLCALAGREHIKEEHFPDHPPDPRELACI